MYTLNNSDGRSLDAIAEMGLENIIVSSTTPNIPQHGFLLRTAIVGKSGIHAIKELLSGIGFGVDITTGRACGGHILTSARVVIGIRPACAIIRQWRIIIFSFLRTKRTVARTAFAYSDIHMGDST